MKRILQITAPSTPAWGVWAEKDGTYFTSPVHLWAVLEDLERTETYMVGLGIDDIHDCSELPDSNLLGYENSDPETWEESVKEHWRKMAEPYCGYSAEARYDGATHMVTRSME